MSHPAKCSDGLSHAWVGNRTLYCEKCGEIRRRYEVSAWESFVPEMRSVNAPPVPAPVEVKVRPTKAGLKALAVVKPPKLRMPGASVNSAAARRRFIAAWFDDFGPWCFYCGRELCPPLAPDAPPDVEYMARGDYPTVDHVIPASLGGPSVTSNLAVACDTCNRDKGAELHHLVTAVASLWQRVRDAEARRTRAEEYIEHLKYEMAALGSSIDVPMQREPRAIRIGCTCGLIHFAGMPLRHAWAPDGEMLLLELGDRAEGSLKGENLGRAATRRAKIAARFKGAERRAKVRASWAAVGDSAVAQAR